MKNENKLENLKILIVDDDIAICELLKEFSNILNIHCDYTVNPSEVGDILSKETFNIIFLDQNLPELKGIDLIKKGYIKSENYFIVMMTGEQLGEKIVSSMLKLGINEFIQKPITLSDFKRVIFTAKNFVLEKENFIEAVKKIKKSTMEIVLDNNLSLVGAVSKMILRNIDGLNFTENPKILHTALIEAIVNAIVHGNLEINSSIKDKGFEQFSNEVNRKLKNENLKNRKVYIYSYLDKNFFKVIIKDEGNGFNWKKFLKNLEDSDTLSFYGRGIKIIKNSFDEVFWNDKGNEITLIKYPLTSTIKEDS